MSLLLVVLILIAVGVVMYFFNSRPWPIDPTFKQIINIVVIIAVIIWLANLFGLLALFGAIKFPSLK